MISLSKFFVGQLEIDAVTAVLQRGSQLIHLASSQRHACLGIGRNGHLLTKSNYEGAADMGAVTNAQLQTYARLAAERGAPWVQ